MRSAGRTRFLYRALRAGFRDQRGEMRALRRALGAGDAALDVGAHKGSYTWWMRRAVGESGRVLALEPQPELAEYLRSACGAFGWDNVAVVEAAASDRPGRATLRVPGAGPSPGASLERAAAAGRSAREIPCETMRLDDLVAREGLGRVALVKVDVEGHELAVFRGAERILDRDRPVLLFECEARHLSDRAPADVFAFLAGRGYEGAFFSRDGMRPISEFDPSRHQPRGPGRFWKAAGYVNNFLFAATPDAGRVFEGP